MTETSFPQVLKDHSDQLSQQIVGAAIEVHRALGPGLLESIYELCMCHELTLRGIVHERQIAVPILYKGIQLDGGYKIDILVEGLVIVELKSIQALEPIHHAQLLTYLRLKHLWLGLLINFNVPVLKQGIKRLVNG